MIARVSDYMSLGEIAEEQGISRQGVYDLVKRCDKILDEYERKLKLVEKFRRTRSMVEQIRRIAEESKLNGDMSRLDEIGRIAEEISKL